MVADLRAGSTDMPVSIERANFADPALAFFLQAHLDDLEPISPPESRHALDLAALQAPGVRLWVARAGGTGALVGTCGLAALTDDHEELKSMRTDPAFRGQGIARRLLEMIIDDSRRRGVRRISLETGSADFFAVARDLYTRAGFVECGPFGRYVADPHSTFMTLELAGDGILERARLIKDG
jgi:putative acetyltransferase